MRVSAQKQNQPQQQASPDITRWNAKALAARQLVYPIMYMQHTIGNQAVPPSPYVNAEALEVGSDTSAPTRFGHDFSRIPVLSKAPIGLQAKLTVNSPGDIYEQEADRTAERVMSMREPQLQRSCACGGGCSSCQNEQTADEGLQMKSVQANHIGEIEAPSIVDEVLHSSGQPLDTSTRRFMESRFGHDFSRVRVHTDARAAESAQSVNAIAYTVGRNIFFGQGRYVPANTHGRRLLAHELTHVVQQGGGNIQRPPVVDRSEDWHKQEAELTERGKMTVSPARHGWSEVKVQRLPGEGDMTEEEMTGGREDTESADSTFGEEVAAMPLKGPPDCTVSQIKCSVCKLPAGSSTIPWATDCTDPKKPYIYSFGFRRKDGSWHYECRPSYTKEELSELKGSDDCKPIFIPKHKTRSLTDVGKRPRYRRKKRWQIWK